MEERYNPGRIEKDAQEYWSSIDAYRAVEHDPRFPQGKFYACSMLPYPSGILHMGHVRNYTINDVMHRYLRMKGFNVLMPMGWDAFGLPAENAAMKNRVAPARWTYDNIAYMKRQMQPLGLAIDWSRELATCTPEYYKWNQWLFLKMRERGVAYRKFGTVNWDPVDQTVLANEQVIDGRGWRSGAPVQKREIPMYYLRITDYAQELLDQVNQLEGWPERVRLMQTNWIGRSEGVRFAFAHDIRDGAGQLVDDGRMHVFTTRADTIMGVTFVAVAPEHPLAAVAAAADPAVATFVERAKAGSAMEADLATMDKEGIRTALAVTHPLTGQRIPVWVGNYVLMSYGDGAVMGVPGHDERDFAFALKYGLPIRQVVAVAGETFSDREWQPWYEEKQRGACVNSGRYDRLSSKAAADAVAADLVQLGVGEKRVQWRLRDWGISRQRYWGTPIPIIHCPACGEVPVPYEALPVVLPEDLVPDGSGNPLLKSESFLACECPSCGKPARRETDTMDTFIDSAWYYMRYCSPGSREAMVDTRIGYWMPMDQYIGGIEHAVLHLLYARFWTKVMRDLGLVAFDEPFTRLLCQGMVLNHIYQRKSAKGGVEYFWPEDVENLYGDGGRIAGARLKSDASLVDYAGVGTMSKSKNNGVDPQALIDRYGADTARLFVMFASPPEQTLEWSDSGVEGASRFLRRLWSFCHGRQQTLREAPGRLDAKAASAAMHDLRFEIHTVLRQSAYDYERKQYNTVVSGAMKMLNALDAAAQAAPAGAMPAADAAVLRECTSVLVRSLYPVVPHIAHALWQDLELGRSAAGAVDIIDATWPEVDESALVRDTQVLVLQVNGKVRGSLQLPADADRAHIEQFAAAAPEVLRLAAGRLPKRIVIVPGRLVNVVV
ncbi:MAG: leucine--tRNA ligase [Lautropia sp.]|nr:leucine--tRNA ligase [Lautropia sp.]